VCLCREILVGMSCNNKQTLLCKTWMRRANLSAIKMWPLSKWMLKTPVLDHHHQTHWRWYKMCTLSHRRHQTGHFCLHHLNLWWPTRGIYVCGPRDFSNSRNVAFLARTQGQHFSDLLNFVYIVNFAKLYWSCSGIHARCMGKHFTNMFETLQWDVWEKFGVVSSTIPFTFSVWSMICY
jgi:hypothetical protein